MAVMELTVRNHDVQDKTLTANCGDVIEFKNHEKNSVFVEPADEELLMAMPEAKGFQLGYPFENVETIPGGGVACLRVRTDIREGTYCYHVSDAVRGPNRGDIKNLTVPYNGGGKLPAGIVGKIYDVFDTDITAKRGEPLNFRDSSGKNHKIEKVNLKQHKELPPGTDITYPYDREEEVGPQGAVLTVRMDLLSNHPYRYQIGPKPEDIKNITVP